MGYCTYQNQYIRSWTIKRCINTGYRLEEYTYINVTNHGRYPNDDNVYTKNIVYKEVLDN